MRLKRLNSMVLGNTGTGNTANNNNEVKITVLCYSPSGLCYEIQASSPGHAEWLQKMNPKLNKAND